MRKILSAFLMLAVATTAVSVAQEWAGRGRATGTVKDEDGKPVEGAEVQLYLRTPENGPEGQQTNEKGRFTFGGLAGGAWTVLIDADGYKPSQGAMNVSQFGSNKPAAIVLAKDPRFSITAGDQMLESGDFAGARASYVQAMEGLDEVGQARLRSRVGDTYVREGNLAAAQKEYEQALAYLAPEEQSHVRISLGNAYQEAGQFAAAREHFEKAVMTLDGEPKAVLLTLLARGYYAEENFDAAVTNLKQAVELSPGNVLAIQVLADILTSQGREQEAATYLAQLPEDAKLPTDMVLNIGIRLFNEGDTEKALEYFDRAVAESPDNPESYYYRGLTHLGAGSNDAALADFKKLLEIDPDTSHKDEVGEFMKFLEQ